MSGPNALTQQSIESLIMPLRYADRSRVACDVLGLLRNSNSLQIKIAPFVHSDGRSETLLSLTGTTPIYYKNACYNIPVTIWVGESYPARPPSCLVTPTKDMRIKDGHMHVDHYGVVYLPYLNQWSAATSNLLEMVTIMSSVFSQDPPVFKVPAAAQAQQQQQQPRMQPAMQISPSVMQQQQQQQAQQQHHPQSQPQVGVYRQAPPVPPPQFNNPYAVAAPQPAGGPSPVSQSYGSSPSPAQPSPHQPQQRYDSSPSPAPIPAVQPQQAQDPRATLKNQLIAQLTLRLRAHLQDDLSLKTLLMDDLLQQQSQVEAHTAAVDARMESLQSDLTQLQRASQQVQAQNGELEKWLDQYESRPMPDIDSVCYVKDTWSKQLLDAVSLDLALDDAFYLLDRSLQEESIDLQSYTKQLRALSRKQFYARALVMHIQQQQAAAQPALAPAAHLAAPQPPRQNRANGVELGGLGGGYVLT